MTWGYGPALLDGVLALAPALRGAGLATARAEVFMAVDPKSDTSAYAPTKAPETAKHAEEKETQPDSRLTPGGAHGSPFATGMNALYRDQVPSEATRSEQLQMGEYIKP